MKLSLTTAIVYLILECYAFPAAFTKHLENLALGNDSLPLITKRTPFDASLQYISNAGIHTFVPPGLGDQRGPCPGLNAMANHNYLPHNGIVTIPQLLEANMKVFGMGLDLATVLAVYGAVFDGNLVSWSIGGPSPFVQQALGLGGIPQGISGSHNKYEGDSSPTRGDLFQYGNDYLVQLPQFQALYDLGQPANTYDLPLLTKFRSTRFNQSISENPYFFYAPFSGLIVEEAAYSFIYRFMANKTATYPDGILDGEVLKSFYSITGNSGKFVYTPGHERIPDNWYTRHPLDPYGVVELVLDGTAMLLQYPEFASIGGNTGTVNSFVGLNPANLTGGVFNAATLLEGNNLFCYGVQVAVQGGPDLITGLLTDVDQALDFLGAAIGNLTDELGCPELNSIDKGQFDIFPGFTKLESNGVYPWGRGG